ncbi:DNA-binding protein [Bacteroides sp. 214]|uniref:HU family DNA-binding protein n=1 Tax=Bacteroides sp. 214 TaxID=2302935 RepID=UPI0013D49E63|nr:HU family DNA-binding protein [Bacteroides sp. 214]NDW13427.1 DNA-binding protein [Bacteroides sp. 214]
MSIPVVRCKRNKIVSDPTSPVLNYLKRDPGHARLYTIDDVASETELVGGMSAEDVTHVMKSFIRSLRKILVMGDKVKIAGLGTFHITFNCQGTELEKDCTVRNIHRVNVRFSVDNTFRLVNDSIATTRGGANNVEFYIKSEKDTSENSNGDGGDGGDGGDFEDPTT